MKTIDSKHVQFDFDASVPPVLRVLPGETVCFETQDCYGNQIDVDGKDYSLVHRRGSNPATGPLFVEGAEPGDVLKVEILSIELPESGAMCVRHGVGVYEVEGAHCRRFPIRDGRVIFDRGIEIPVRPMIGVIGTCSMKPCDTETPGEHGGNLDIRDLGAGSTVYLPVCVPGALLSLGDCHAVQGDGETAICALEIEARATVRVSLLKDAGELPTPFLETDDSIYTIAADESLDVASADAARRMHRYLTRTTALTDA